VARRLWLLVHRWLALGLGLLFVLMGATGSLLVFRHAIDAWLNPERFTPSGAGPPRPLDEIVTAARAAAPGTDAGVAVLMPGSIQDVFVVYLSPDSRHESGAPFAEVMIDPPTARVLGRRAEGQNLTAWLLRLHYTLLLREPGGVKDGGMYLMGVVGLFLVVSTTTGLYLWWPRVSQIGQAIRVRGDRGARRLTFDLHRAVGFWSSLVLLTLAGSGVYMIFPFPVRSIIGTVAQTAPEPEHLRSAPRAGAPVSPAQAVAIASSRVPDGTVTSLSLEGEATATYHLHLRRPGDVQRVYGDSTVWIDQWSGAVLEVRHARATPAAEVVLHWQYPLHSGEALGLAGRLAVLVAGVAPLTLLVTGVMMWWRRRGARRRVAARHARALIRVPV
jgi:uncharacterized iron-regulated membrane protein